jgi:predicted nucleic acid-binding protein
VTTLAGSPKGRKYLMDPSTYCKLVLTVPENRAGSLIGSVALLNSSHQQVAQTLLDLINARKVGRRGSYKLVEAFSQALAMVHTITINPMNLKDVFKISFRESIGIDWASLIYAARRHRLRLVSESAELLNAASKYCKTVKPDAVAEYREFWSTQQGTK